VTFTSTVAGSSAPYTFAWDFDNEGVTDCGTAQCTHTYTSPFTGTIGLTVTDNQGCQTTLFIENGWAARTRISPTFTFTPESPVIGQQVTFTSSVTGGTAPYPYEWDFNEDGLTDCTTTYDAVFEGNVMLRIRDRYGCQADVYTAEVSVAAAPPPSGGGGGGCFIRAAALHVPRLLLVAFVACALSGVGFMALRHRRRNQKNDSSSVYF
jgi:PKD repeat protein